MSTDISPLFYDLLVGKNSAFHLCVSAPWPGRQCGETGEIIGMEGTWELGRSGFDCCHYAFPTL